MFETQDTNRQNPFRSQADPARDGRSDAIPGAGQSAGPSTGKMRRDPRLVLRPKNEVPMAGQAVGDDRLPPMSEHASAQGARASADDHRDFRQESQRDGQGDDQRDNGQRDRPLVDIATILRSVWQVRLLIIALTVVGTIGGVLVAMATPSSYVSESKLYVDPREVRLTDSDLSKQSLATEGILALVDSQLEVLRSRAVLEKVASDLGLDRDAEFGTVAATSGGLSGGVNLVRELVFGKAKTIDSSSQDTAKTLEKLEKAITVSRDPKTFIVAVQVKSRSPEKSALIANKLVATFLNEESAAQSGFFQRTTEALDGRIEQLRKELDQAEKAVETYKAENDIVGAAGELISDKLLLSLNDQVGGVRTRMADAKAKAELASTIQLDDILSGAFPEEIGSTTLGELRKQFSEARAQLGSLDASLGPRHPQRLAAAQSLEVARSEIGNELRRIAATAQTEYQRAQAAEADLVAQLNAQKARQVNSSSGFVELRELERKASATQAIYESFLKRVRETGEEEKLTSKNIRVISTAEPALQPVGPSRKLIAIGGLFLGFAAGVGIGILLGMIRSLRAIFDGERGRPAREIEERQTEENFVAPARTVASAQPASSTRDDAIDAAADTHAARPEPIARPIRTTQADHAALVAREAAIESERSASAECRAPSENAPLAFAAAGSGRTFKPSDHSLAAFNAARGAAPPHLAAADEDIDEVRDTLRALRSRVEHYARQQSGRRG